MEVSRQLHSSAALPPGKEPLLSSGNEAGWAPEPVWTWFWRKKIPSPCRDSNPPIIQPVAQRCTTGSFGNSSSAAAGNQGPSIGFCVGKVVHYLSGRRILYPWRCDVFPTAFRLAGCPMGRVRLDLILYNAMLEKLICPQDHNET
jgi:hypothetical protein